MLTQASNIEAVIQNLHGSLFRKLVWLITKKYGLAHYQEAEDAISFAFENALREWPKSGLPNNPAAWITTVAKNKALDYHKLKKATPLDIEPVDETEIINNALLDPTLEMAFACCHPELSQSSQIALTLRTLFNFSLEQICSALFLKYDAAEKRLQRARSQAKELGIKPELPNNFEERLPIVIHIIYLIFNEGYNNRSESGRDLKVCEEAFYLLMNIGTHPSCQKGYVKAIQALFCYHLARIDSRYDKDNNFIDLESQDRLLWDKQLISYGNTILQEASGNESITTYHLEAAIASVHCNTGQYNSTNWEVIINYYEQLLKIRNDNSTLIGYLVAHLNCNGAESTIKLFSENKERLKDSFYAQLLLLKIYKKMGTDTLSEQSEVCLQLAKNENERKAILKVIGE